MRPSSNLSAPPAWRRLLQHFGPSVGPQWDGLARSDVGNILLVEAKAHIDELFSPACQAGMQLTTQN